MPRLKQIKKRDLGEFGKQVVDSLIQTRERSRKESKEEQMRCKVEIFEGNSQKRSLTDSFIVNTNFIEDTVAEIVDKYGADVQFVITNLYDEKVVAKRFVYTDGFDKEKEDRNHYSHTMELVKKVLKLKEEGKSEEDVCDKFCSIASRSYIEKIYERTEEENKQMLRDEYENQSLGKTPEILSEDLNTKKDILTNSNLEGEQDEE